MKSHLLYFLLLGLPAESGIREHLKPALNKPAPHSIEGVDFTYVINLDQRPEKWERSRFALSLYDIEPYRFSAVNGWELSLEDLDDVGFSFFSWMQKGVMGTCYHLDGHFEPSHELIQNEGQTYFCHCMARGTIGCVLSHLSVLQDAHESGYETIWVMEDDIALVKSPRLISQCIEELDQTVGKENWDILFTDRDMKRNDGSYTIVYWPSIRPDYAVYSTGNDYTLNKPISPRLRQLGARYGAHSMIIRRSGIEKLRLFLLEHKVFLPYDIEYVLPQGIKLFTVLEDIVSNTPHAPSDNGAPNYIR